MNEITHENPNVKFVLGNEEVKFIYRPPTEEQKNHPQYEIAQKLSDEQWKLDIHD